MDAVFISSLSKRQKKRKAGKIRKLFSSKTSHSHSITLPLQYFFFQQQHLLFLYSSLFPKIYLSIFSLTNFLKPFHQSRFPFSRSISCHYLYSKHKRQDLFGSVLPLRSTVAWNTHYITLLQPSVTVTVFPLVCFAFISIRPLAFIFIEFKLFP